MIKNLLFDFDGVILDSMKIKGDGFIELFKSYPKTSLQQLEAYHYANGGISRFAKIRYFFHDILHTQISEKAVENLANQFAQIIAEKIFDRNNLIGDTIDYIQKNFTHYNCHIVSGAEHRELNALCEYFEITHYFKSIQGSPIIKSQLITNLIKNNHYEPEETLLIGDSVNDYEAAYANKIQFYGYNNAELQQYNYITTFQGIHFE